MSSKDALDYALAVMMGGFGVLMGGVGVAFFLSTLRQK